MKIIIEHSRTKRTINGAFNICGSEDDLRNIANQILEKTKDFHYGWIFIVPEVQESIANQEPIGWE